MNMNSRLASASSINSYTLFTSVCLSFVVFNLEIPTSSSCAATFCFFVNVNDKVFKWCASQIAPAPSLLVTYLLVSFTQIKWLISSSISTTIRINLLLVCLHWVSWWIEHPSPFVITVWFIACACVSVWVCASVCMMSVYMWLYDIYIGSPVESSIPDVSVFILYVVIVWESILYVDAWVCIFVTVCVYLRQQLLEINSLLLCINVCQVWLSG